jgi:hypothetical protein
MGKIGTYQPIDKYKNYLLPTTKPLKSHAFYKEKVWTLQEQIYQKLKKVAELLENLYPKLTDDFSKNIKVVIEKHLKTLIKDLNLIKQSLHTNSDSFDTNKLKINHHHITEMKNVCDTLQTVRSYEYEFKNLSKIKHALSELEHLIQPTSFEKSLEKAHVKSKQKTAPAMPAKKRPILVQTKKKVKKEPILVQTKKKVKKEPILVQAKKKVKKEPILVQAKKKVKKEPIVKSKNQKALSKKTKTATKLPKQIKVVSKQPKKSATALSKLKSSEKKVTKPKPKLSAKKVLKAKL